MGRPQRRCAAADRCVEGQESAAKKGISRRGPGAHTRAGAERVELHRFGLTEREQDVLTQLVSGLSYAQIARDLFVSQSTVSYHLSNIYRKAQVSSRHELTELVRRDPMGYGHCST